MCFRPSAVNIQNSPVINDTNNNNDNLMSPDQKTFEDTKPKPAEPIKNPNEQNRII